MRRWLATFLLVLLPLQFSWAAAASYCQHETGPATKHFGHHEHKHHQDSNTTSDDLKLSVDADCAACHAGCAAATVTVSSLALDTAPAVPAPWFPHAPASPPKAQPERPNWSVSV
jgi:hypothetical protein